MWFRIIVFIVVVIIVLIAGYSIYQLYPSERGILVFEKDNPFGLQENANELRIPVVFE